MLQYAINRPALICSMLAKAVLGIGPYHFILASAYLLLHLNAHSEVAVQCVFFLFFSVPKNLGGRCEINYFHSNLLSKRIVCRLRLQHKSMSLHLFCGMQGTREMLYFFVFCLDF